MSGSHSISINDKSPGNLVRTISRIEFSQVRGVMLIWKFIKGYYALTNLISFATLKSWRDRNEDICRLSLDIVNVQFPLSIIKKGDFT